MSDDFLRETIIISVGRETADSLDHADNLDTFANFSHELKRLLLV